jgi:2-polyprenyl-3-methyl-5-hydroxy-6-metoxy-1,4-benzoquinol methylase
MENFYDNLANLYHLIFEDWNTSLERQGELLSDIIQKNWSNASYILDLSCGIGTQSLALAKHSYQVTASDLSVKSMERAKREAQNRSLKIAFSICDMRQALVCHGGGFNVVISCDNSVPHLLTDEDILKYIVN